MVRPIGTDKHGTVTGYDWHKRHSDPVCEPCLEAKRDYSRDSARGRRQAEIDDAPRKAAWWRACGRLAERYPQEFRTILEEEMQGVKLNLPPEDEDEETA